MKYITSVKLKNFQSHKNTQLDFDNKLNIIVGASDSGKTAIIRGIKWVLYNEPLGDYFISKGEKECSVKLTFNDGTRVTRYKSSNKNAYELIDALGEITIFESFGRTVPEEIAEATAIKHVELDINNNHRINIGEQLEGAFLLSETGSTKASAIGRIVGVNLIDDALKEGLVDSRRLKDSKMKLSNDLKRLTGELDEFDYLDDLQLRLEKLVGIERSIKEKILLSKNLEKILDNFDSILNNKEKYKNIINETKFINKTNKTLDKIDSKLKSLNLLTYKEENYKKVKYLINDNSNSIDKLDNLDHMEKLLSSLGLKHNKYKNLKSLDLLYDKITVEKEVYTPIRSSLQKLELVEDACNKILEIKKVKDTYESYYLSLKDIDNRLNIGRRYFDKFKSLEDAISIKDKITRQLDKKIKLEKLLLKYIEIDDSIKSQVEKLKLIESQISLSLKKYTGKLSENKICPICFSQIDEDKILEITEFYREDRK